MEERRVILTPNFTPSFEQYKRSIRFEDLDDAQEEALHMFHVATEKLQPKVLFCEKFIDEHTTVADLPSITIENVVFSGKALRVLSDVTRVFAYVATCGTEMEEIDFSHFDMLAPYWVDSIKNQALRDARIALISYMKETHLITTPKSLNPGSGNVDIWPIEQQRALFEIIGGTKDIGVSLSDSCLMNPNKSISGFMFANPTIDYESCAYCEREHCPNRRVPFKERM